MLSLLKHCTEGLLVVTAGAAAGAACLCLSLCRWRGLCTTSAACTSYCWQMKYRWVHCCLGLKELLLYCIAM